MMGKLIDEMGNRYGRLVILGRAEKRYQRGSARAHWWCQCDCGNKTVIAGLSLRGGLTKSCGCLQKERVSQSNTINRVGDRYGRLTVIKRHDPVRSGQTHWLCKCDCGNEVIVLGNNLHRGTTRSCGCLWRDTCTLPKGMAAFNALLSNMKRGAKVRGYDWQLTDEQVAHLTKQPCHYCGIAPLQVHDLEGCNGGYVFNGLDRIDNDRGYTIDNVIPCCIKCNRAKHTMTSEEFKMWIARLYEHLVVKGD